MKSRFAEFRTYLRYDFAAAGGRVWGLLPFSALAVLAASLGGAILWRSHPELTAPPSLGNLLFAAYQGAPPYTPGSGQGFLPPFLWIAAVFPVLLPTLQYPYGDFMRRGAQIFSRCRTRVLWMLAKLVFVLTVTTAAFLVQIATAFAVSALSGEFSFFVTEDCLAMRGAAADPRALTVYMLVGVWLALLALAAVQFALGFFLKPVLACFGTLAQLVVGSYFQSPFFPACCAMALRFCAGEYAPVSLPVTAAVSAAVLLAAAALTSIYIRRKEIL